ncbi:hypothetical protein COV04_04410 [Candidatus Uhrbacteria bacterium CG10_big_fil_rev_8_21_14_0_10_48_11]|uniref:Uncharacterized protein n=1 Tax=Candidatus Uhrbacteria bacterium CG10_big_fil_rev_8_21_14_0_10_48_11 TaxID=1975037 RepID=A0A2M8LDM4_9BACT|nr:MAG: hypothetical protein COV04_04410 [Candidatus Uhrbacteria bacterium CG10_big_fil_rev_8_21_14_0_10_48_11]
MFHVTVATQEGEQTTHTVRLQETYWQKLTGSGKVSAQDLVEATFDFLLKREGNESILPEFDIAQVAEFFPEFEGVIRQQL